MTDHQCKIPDGSGKGGSGTPTEMDVSRSGGSGIPAEMDEPRKGGSERQSDQENSHSQTRPYGSDHGSQTRPDKGVEILEQRMLVPNLNEITVYAPAVARKIQPGQFIILRADDHSERIPLTVADWDREAGTITCIFMQVGTSTQKLGSKHPGDRLPTFVGPLGHPLELENYGTVVLTGGCYGIGALYPTARRLKELGNTVIAMVEARGSFLLYWIDKYRKIADEVIISTFDGSKPGKKGEGPVHLGELLASGRQIDRIFALGCTFMMFETAKVTRPFNVKTIVSLNPIMIDGTGMCGACRVVVGGETKFACVDGPDFDAHQIDWELLLTRRKPYMEAEAVSVENW